MPYLQLLFLVHLFLLIFLNWRTARRLFASDFPALFATVLLAWANLIHTAQIASFVGILDVSLAYFLISLGVSLGYGKLFAQICPEAVASDGITFGDVAAQVRSNLFTLVLAVLLGFIGVCVLLLALSVLPNNWDTLAYRFPRVIFYLKSAALIHPSPGLDARMLFYPYNGSLLYLFLAEYQLSGVTWNLVSVFGWLTAGAGAFYVPLFFGGTVRGAMFSAYALMTAPIVLCVANSTNDELLAGAPLLLGIIFLAGWLRDKGLASLVLAMIGLAISAGVKLHVIFYAPMILIAIVWALRAQGQTLREHIQQELLPKLKPAGMGLLLALPLAVGFMVTNYVSSGKITDTGFNKGVLNAPFHPGAAFQNLQLLTAQLFFSPIPDHARAFGVEKGVAAYKATNEAFGKTIFKNVKQGPPYTSAFYQFRGISSPYAEAFFEETLWLGMVPWAILITLVWMVLKRHEVSLPLWLLLLSLPVWHIALAVFHLYVECIGTYYAYSAPLGLAAIGLVWERMNRSGDAFGNIASKVLVAVLISNTLMAGTLLFSSQKRDVTQAFRATDGEKGPSETSQLVRNTFAKAKQVYIPYTHWELLYWNLMRLNPTAKYFTGNYPASARIDLFAWPYYSRYSWDVPAVVRASRMADFKLLGSMSNGDEVIVCGGPTCLAECPACDDVFLLPLKFQKKGPLIDLYVAGQTQGLNPKQEGFVRFTMFNAQTLSNNQSAWVPLAGLEKFRTTVADANFDHVLIETSCEAGPECLISRTTLPFNPGLRPLLDQMPEFSPSLDNAKISSIFGNGWEGTEGSGYWKFIWKLRPGTNKLDASWQGGGGEKATDELTVSLITEKQVMIHRKGYNSYYVGTWYPSKTPTAKGYAAWDPSNIWFGKKIEAGAKAEAGSLKQ